MQEYQKRVIEEKNDLSAKIDRLDAFIKNDKFYEIDSAEQARLRVQREHMKSYLYVLHDRIDNFQK